MTENIVNTVKKVLTFYIICVILSSYKTAALSRGGTLSLGPYQPTAAGRSARPHAKTHKEGLMFYIKSFMKGFGEKPYIYILILLTFAASVLGTSYFFCLFEGNRRVSPDSEGVILYGVIAVGVAVLCCVDIGFQFAHLMACNRRRYSIYRACGASFGRIAGLAFVEGVLTAVVGYAAGALLANWLVPIFTASLEMADGMSAPLQLLVFGINFFFVIVTYLITLVKSGRRTVFEQGVSE